MSPEVPPPSRIVWKSDAQQRSALPICRSCAVSYQIELLMPFPTEHTCQIERCENAASYLAIV